MLVARFNALCPRLNRCSHPTAALPFISALHRGVRPCARHQVQRLTKKTNLCRLSSRNFTGERRRV